MKFRNLNRFIINFDNTVNNKHAYSGIRYCATHYSHKLLINNRYFGICISISDLSVEIRYMVNHACIFGIYYTKDINEHINVFKGNYENLRWSYSDSFYHYGDGTIGFYAGSPLQVVKCPIQLFQPIKDYCKKRHELCNKCEKITYI